MVSSLRHSLPQLAPRYHFWLYTDAGSYVFCEITQRFRESSLSVFQKRADCLRIAIPTGQVSSLRCSHCICPRSHPTCSIYLAISQKTLPRDSMRAKLNITPRPSRKNQLVAASPPKKHPTLNPVYVRDTLRPLKPFSRSSSKFFCRHFFLAIFCTAVQIRLRIRHSAPKLYPMHQRNKVSARPEQTCISSRGQIFSCFASLYISNMPNKIFFGHFLRELFGNIFQYFCGAIYRFLSAIFFLHIDIDNLFFNQERRNVLWRIHLKTETLLTLPLRI